MAGDGWTLKLCTAIVIAEVHLHSSETLHYVILLSGLFLPHSHETLLHYAILLSPLSLSLCTTLRYFAVVSLSLSALFCPLSLSISVHYVILLSCPSLCTTLRYFALSVHYTTLFCALSLSLSLSLSVI